MQEAGYWIERCMKRKKRKGKEYKGKKRNNSKKTLSYLSLTMELENGRLTKGIIGGGGTMKNTLHQITYKAFLNHEQSKNLHHFH